MTKIYGVLGFETKEERIVERFKSAIGLFKNCETKKTRRNTYIVDWETQTYKTFDIEEVTKEMCREIKPYAKDIGHIYSEESDNCYMDICLVIYKDEEGVSIILNREFLDLVNVLGVSIQFDGI